MKSSMFLNNVTCVDHAYINDQGFLIGGSYSPKFKIIGEVDPHENVVVDFSTIKKDLKAIIDDHETGFDHKLIWINGISTGKISVDDQTISIITDHVEMRSPRNCVKIIDLPEQSEADISKCFSDFCLAGLLPKYPNINLEVEVELSTDFDSHPDINSDLVPFRYAHGLKNSTSYGCQNIAHGHLSFIGASVESGSESQANALLKTIAGYLDQVVFVWQDNIVDHGENYIITEYDCERGHMYLKLIDHTVMVNSTETTIEHLTSSVAELWYDALKTSGINELFVSEGLSKGSNFKL